MKNYILLAGNIPVNSLVDNAMIRNVHLSHGTPVVYSTSTLWKFEAPLTGFEVIFRNGSGGGEGVIKQLYITNPTNFRGV